MRTEIKQDVAMMDLLLPLECSLQVLVKAYPRMTILQMRVFTAIAAGQTTIAQIATATGRHRDSIYRAVDTLSLGNKLNNEEGGLDLIQRSMKPEGRPCNLLTLTPKGQQLAVTLSSALGITQLSDSLPVPTPPRLSNHRGHTFQWLTGIFSWWSLFGGGR